jgi:hypothetical protein
MATINPRARALAQVSRAATQPARITQAARPTTADPALNAWIGAMHEWRHVREGGGNPFEKVLTGRDLVAMGLATSSQITNPSTPARREQPGVVVHDGQGGSSIVGYEEFAASIRGTRLYHDLVRKIDDPTRFDELHARTKAALLEELAPIDGRIRSEIRRVEEQFSNASEAFAQEVTTLRASVARASAGVRQVRAASANENRATAAQVTTVTARLDDFDGGGATVEETMTAIADRATGLEAQYTLKVTAGGAMAGFGLAATDSGSGNATSAFIIQADKFAIVDSSYAGGLDTTPSADAIMFGVDGTGAYFKGDIRGGGDLHITGQAEFEGVVTTSDGTAAIHANSSGASVNGVVAAAGSSGYGVIGWTASGNAGVWGYSIIGTSVGVKGSGGLGLLPAGSAGVHGTTPSAVAYGVVAENTGGGTALRVLGNMTISSTTKVTNLNADQLDGLDSTAFALSGHNHSGTYLPIGGTAADSSALGGTAAASWCRVVVGNTGTANASGNGFNMQMGTGLAPTYEVNCSGNNIVLQTASDRTLKQNIVDEPLGMGFVRALRPRQFRFISDPEYMQHGFIAQEVAAVATPNGEKDSLAFTREDGIMGINHLMLFAPVVKALQEIDARLTAHGI